jgi:hypothetical protein
LNEYFFRFKFDLNLLKEFARFLLTHEFYREYGANRIQPPVNINTSVEDDDALERFGTRRFGRCIEDEATSSSSGHPAATSSSTVATEMTDVNYFIYFLNYNSRFHFLLLDFLIVLNF